MIYILNPKKGPSKNKRKPMAKKKPTKKVARKAPRKVARKVAKAPSSSSIRALAKAVRTQSTSLARGGSNESFGGYLEAFMPSKRGSSQQRTISPAVMAHRKYLRKIGRYSSQARFFRPKLMVDVKTGKVYASPLAGGSYVVNPSRKSIMRKARKAVRHVARKVSRRRYKRNPIAIKQIFNKGQIIKVASIGAGFVGAIKAQKYVNGMSFLASYRRFTGLIPVVAGLLLVLKGKKEIVKSLGTGVSLAGLYDLVTQNIPQLKLSPVEGVDLDDTYAGIAMDVNGDIIDLQGETQLVGEDVSLVGNDDSPYLMI